MNKKVGIIYATIDGQTLKICNRIVEVFKRKNLEIELFDVNDFKENLNSFEKLIIGSSIRYGIHNEKIIDFVKVNKQILDIKKTAFFSVNLVARKPQKNKANTNPYVIKFFKNNNWRPNVVEVFAGMLDYKKYKFFDRLMIQFIMWITKGPTNKETKIEYTDWDKVDRFGEELTTF